MNLIQKLIFVSALVLAVNKLTAQIKPDTIQFITVKQPTFEAKIVNRAKEDTIFEVLRDTSYTNTIIPLSYFCDLPTPDGYLFGNGSFLFKTRNKRIDYTSESGQTFRNYKNTRIKSVLVYGYAGTKGSAEKIYAKVYSVDKDSLPLKLLAKGSVDLTTVQTKANNGELTRIDFNTGDGFIADGDFIISIDYSQVVDDTFCIVNRYKLSTTKLKTADYSIVMRFSSFLAGRWGGFEKINFGTIVSDYSGLMDIDLFMLPIIEKNAQPLTVKTSINSEAKVFADLEKKQLQIFELNNPENYSYQICDANGRLISNGRLNASNKITNLNLTQGVYYLKLVSNQKFLTIPFIAKSL